MKNKEKFLEQRLTFFWGSKESPEVNNEKKILSLFDKGVPFAREFCEELPRVEDIKSKEIEEINFNDLFRIARVALLAKKKGGLQKADMKTIKDMFALLNDPRYRPDFSSIDAFITDYRFHQFDYMTVRALEYFKKTLEGSDNKKLEEALRAIKNLTDKKLLPAAKLEHLALQENMKTYGAEIYKIIRGHEITGEYWCTNFVAAIFNRKIITFKDKEKSITKQIIVQTDEDGQKIKKITFAIFDSEHTNISTAEDKKGTTIWEKTSLSDEWEKVVKN